MGKRKRDEGDSAVSLELQLQQHLQDCLEDGEMVVVVTGAGISVSSGIPPYRGASNAVWESFVEEWGTRKKFLSDPLSWYNSFWLPKFTTKKVLNAKPNPAHEAIATLQQTYKNLYVITQNMDNLHQEAGSPVEQLIHVHGQLGLYRCTRQSCPHSHTSQFSFTDTELDQLETEEEELTKEKAPLRKKKRRSINNRAHWTWKRLPRCPLCGFVAIPLTLMFDEAYESHDYYQIKRATQWLDKCKLMLFVGTSHAVNITRTAEDIGYVNSIPIYNINVRDSINGMVNILAKAEILLPVLSSRLLSSRVQSNINKPKENIPTWKIIHDKTECESLANHPLLLQLLFNRAIPLYTLQNRVCGTAYKYSTSKDDGEEIKAILTIAPNGIGYILGFVLDTFGDEMYDFFNSVVPNRATFLWLLLDSYSQPLDEKISLRSIPRIHSIPSLPKQLAYFLKQKEKLNKEKLERTLLAKKRRELESKEVYTETMDTPDIDMKSNHMVIDLYVGFLFSEETFRSIHGKILGVAVEDGQYSYIGPQKRSFTLQEMSNVLWDLYVHEIHPWLGKVYSSYQLFQQSGGFGYCITKAHDGDIDESMFISACVSSFVANEFHQIDVFTNPDYGRKGFATACAYAFIHRCNSLKCIPSWTCSTKSDAALRIGKKLGFTPVSILPALYRDAPLNSCVQISPLINTQ